MATGKTRAELARERADAVDLEYENLLRQEPDLATLQDIAKRRQDTSSRALLNALAAQFAGEQYSPVQETMLKRSSSAAGPLKVGSAVIEDGVVTNDPYAMQERRLQAMDVRSRRAASAADAAEAQAERLAAQSRENAANRALRETLAHITTNKERTLPWTAVQDMSKKAGSADTLSQLTEEFKPEYASPLPGVPGVGAVGNFLGRAGLGNQDKANWWQRYNEQANQIRNELFGSALTATEKAAFDAAMISPDMDEKVIARRLRQQATAAQSAYERLVQSAAGSGYDTKGLPPVRTLSSGLTSNAAGSTSQAETIKYDANGKRIK